MNHDFVAVRKMPNTPSLIKGPKDTLVLFGELFQRGYANGLVEQAQKQGAKIITATVGRRDGGSSNEGNLGELRPLTPQELALIPFECINVPLEAGFDREAASDGLNVLDRLKNVKLSNWDSALMDWPLIEESQKLAKLRFRNNVKLFFNELSNKVNPEGNVIISHLMAGGVPRHKIVLALLSRTVKGVGEKYFSSQKLWESDLGKLIARNFLEVTAETFNILLQEADGFIKNHKGKVAFTAYGYHGTEVFIENKLTWQSYTPYLQGWAKIALENYAKEHAQKGLACTVYNCPEILTQSSSIFQGVEIPLYPLLNAFKLLAPTSKTTLQLWQSSQGKLKDGVNLDELLKTCDYVLQDKDIKELNYFDLWPQHSSAKQLEKILVASDAMLSAHKDFKDVMTNDLSEIIFQATGKVILAHAGQANQPVVCLGHDVVVDASL